MLRGRDGNDTIRGDAGRDSISAMPATTLDGGGEDDRVSGGDGDDQITGGSGATRSSAAAATTRSASRTRAATSSSAGRASDTVYVEDDAPTVNSSTRARPWSVPPRPATTGRPSVVYGGFGNDTLFGTAEARTPSGSDGDDVLDGLDSDDYVDGETPTTSLRAEAATIRSTAAATTRSSATTATTGSKAVSARLRRWRRRRRRISGTQDGTHRGRPGDDRVDESTAGTDRIDCGEGYDIVSVDPTDVIISDSCETIRR